MGHHENRLTVAVRSTPVDIQKIDQWGILFVAAVANALTWATGIPKEVTSDIADSS